MNMLRGAAVAACALMLNACGAGALAGPLLSAASPAAAASGPAVEAKAGRVSIEGRRALILAANAYQAAASAAAIAVKAGAFDKAALIRLSALNDRALTLLESGAAGMADVERAAALFAIADEISRIGGK